ncbi:hypothetical protein EGW08_023688, partial [Elysia chlorotica]
SEVALCTTQACGARYSVISVDQSSTLTISSVSRTDPFNMETSWAIRPCAGAPITVCDRLEVYALPENPSCTVREEPDSGDTRSVTVSCSTSKVYPRAECRFYSKTDNGDSVQINNQITYSHREISGTPVYYRSECSVTVEVKDLGEGTHSFTGYIYPNVTGGDTLVGGSDGDKTVTLIESACSPVEEGQQTTLSHAVNTNSCTSNNLLTWRAGGSEVAQCTAQGCGARYSVISVDQSSTLTISSVSRTDPFNMETRWTISPCGGSPITVCNKLEVY